jgi:hypothetical protein
LFCLAHHFSSNIINNKELNRLITTSRAGLQQPLACDIATVAGKYLSKKYPVISEFLQIIRR